MRSDLHIDGEGLEVVVGVSFSELGSFNLAQVHVLEREGEAAVALGGAEDERSKRHPEEYEEDSEENVAASDISTVYSYRAFASQAPGPGRPYR